MFRKMVLCEPGKLMLCKACYINLCLTQKSLSRILKAAISGIGKSWLKKFYSL